MDKAIVTKRHSLLKEHGTYQSAHELLCARLQQARTVADVAAGGEISDKDRAHLVWCIADILEEACAQCEQLTAEDFKPIE